MIQSLEAFMSQHDVESGARWVVEIAEELDEGIFGLLCFDARQSQCRLGPVRIGARFQSTSKAEPAYFSPDYAPSTSGAHSLSSVTALFQKEGMTHFLRDLTSKMERS